MIQIYRGTEINLKLSTLIVYTFDLSDILSDLFISNSTLFIVFKIGSILILKVTVSGSLLYGGKQRFGENKRPCSAVHRKWTVIQKPSSVTSFSKSSAVIKNFLPKASW